MLKLKRIAQQISLSPERGLNFESSSDGVTSDGTWSTHEETLAVQLVYSYRQRDPSQASSAPDDKNTLCG